MSEVEALLNCARDVAVRYIAELGARDVMPTQAALAELATLREPVPFATLHPFAVIQQVDRLGSQATVATTGGRFFGFVVGGALPVKVAATPWHALS